MIYSNALHNIIRIPNIEVVYSTFKHANKYDRLFYTGSGSLKGFSATMTENKIPVASSMNRYFWTKNGTNLADLMTLGELINRIEQYRLNR